MSNPRLLSTYPADLGGEINAVGILGNTIFAAEGSSGLQILDISNTSNPRVVSSYPCSQDGGFTQDLIVAGSTVFIAETTPGLQMIDVTVPANPRLISTYSSGNGQAYGVAVSGNIAFIGNWDGGLQIVDISKWQLTATPDIANVGNYQLQLTATDELGGSASTQPFTIRVEGPPQFHGIIPSAIRQSGSII